MGKKESAEETIKNIRRQTRRQYSAEEKIRMVLEGLRGEDGVRGSPRASTTSGPKNFWRRASRVWLATPNARPVVTM